MPTPSRRAISVLAVLAAAAGKAWGNVPAFVTGGSKRPWGQGYGTGRPGYKSHTHTTKRPPSKAKKKMSAKMAKRSRRINAGRK